MTASAEPRREGLEEPGLLLTVAIPTRDRPALLERAIRSAQQACRDIADVVEFTVSDGSATDESSHVVSRLLGSWPGGYRYVRNEPPLSLPENINRVIGLGTAPWVLQLHDDDFLLPQAGGVIAETIERLDPGERVLLFGVEIVDEHGVRRRTQAFRREERLEPTAALRRLLSRSSFVRQPAVVIHRSAFAAEGMYDTTIGGSCDTEMYVRLFARFGVRCVPQTTCAYTVHAGAATAGMWNAQTVRHVDEIFDRAAALRLVPDRSVRRWEAAFINQFILAGAYRSLRMRQRGEASQVLRLFNLPEVRRLRLSLKWLPVRVAFQTLSVGARSRAT
jgi:hypothetical protein